ncbi:Uma2 family endonuclease [Streptomyces sporangiiformans]|uniref:Uma2 family endonuclease n=1 Tax=Streptomyces sporangiiformans TaxID=2315329 RepID=A0A505DIT0_9ACTN|nr:Uma2 family endonuclease [Streptomyces sporangiiformans]TPQ19246.1 Uma2 family endonuclease [Streptomyces sporangiiformans]
MTVLEDRIEMAESSDDLTLDAMFEWLEKMPIPEGTKAEIVGGNIFMSPQRRTHWRIILNILKQLWARYPEECLMSDVRIDFPGHLNGFAADVAALVEGFEPDDKGRLRYQDVEFVAEVISKDTGRNDYEPKKDAYAAAGVPVYLIVDPYTGQWHLHTLPKDGAYRGVLSLDFGDEIDLSGTTVGLVLKTDEFPRD